jgi:hypothetical protein
MSKRVEVREGDGWGIYHGSLWQIRSDDERLVVNNDNVEGQNKFEPIVSGCNSYVASSVARAWIESLGGEWAEVAEEKKPEAVKVAAYAADNGRVDLFVVGTPKQEDAELEAKYRASYYRSITIAGVTT